MSPPNSLYNQDLRKAWEYGVRHLAWQLYIEVDTKYHTFTLRVLKDLKTGEIRRYDILIDGITGPDASSVDELLDILRNDPGLKWIAKTLEKHIRLRRLMK